MSRPELGAWEVDFLRATAFTSDAVSPSYGDEIWKKVAQTDAEEITRKPSLGTYSAASPLGNAMLALNIAPGRIDWVLAPASMEAVLDHSLGQFSKQDEEFADRLSPWLQFPSISITRIAFGEVLRLPVANRVAGYRTLRELIRAVAPDPESARDFLYQINKPRDSRVAPGLLVNRLTKWASVDLQVGVAHSSKPTSTQAFVRLELDLSTDKDAQRDLAKEKTLGPILREMMQLGREIATEGDIS
jgi:hypothetical protein